MRNRTFNTHNLQCTVTSQLMGMKFSKGIELCLNGVFITVCRENINTAFPLLVSSWVKSKRLSTGTLSCRTCCWTLSSVTLCKTARYEEGGSGQAITCNHHIDKGTKKQVISSFFKYRKGVKQQYDLSCSHQPSG